MNVVVLGAGYVGLVSAACLAEFGFHITCVDRNSEKISLLQSGNVPIFEPGLDDLIHRNRSRLTFSTQSSEAIQKAEVVIIAVGTPADPTKDGEADLTFVFEAAEEIARNLHSYKVVVTKSTVPEGTGRAVHDLIQKFCGHTQYDVVSNPEFLREGSAIEDFMKPDRIVVGASSTRAFDVMRQLYKPLENGGYPIIQVSVETAELIKYASNAFLATKIAFINQLSELCEYVGADIQDVARGMGMDQRIGPKFLQVGPGFGGSCFPKDILALRQRGRALGVDMSIVDAVITGNAAHRLRMVDKIIHAMGGHISDKTIACLGVTFKANTDDMRDSPSLDIIPALRAHGAKIKIYDPIGMENARIYLDNYDFCATQEEALSGASAAVILTEWNEFRGLSPETLEKHMTSPLLIDLRNIFEPSDFNDTNVCYVSLGRRTQNFNLRAVEAFSQAIA